jgi:hypothetical protein
MHFVPSSLWRTSSTALWEVIAVCLDKDCRGLLLKFLASADSRLTREKKGREAEVLPPSSDLDVGGCDSSPFQKRRAARKGLVSAARHAVRDKHQRKLDRKHTSSPDRVDRSKGEE